MVGSWTKRAVNGVVLLLAASAFFFLPLGGKTPAEHLAAIVATEPAQEAGRALVDTCRRLLERTVSERERLRRAEPLEKSAPQDSGHPDPAGDGTPRPTPSAPSAAGTSTTRTPVGDAGPPP